MPHFSMIDTYMSSTDSLTSSPVSANAQGLDATTHANIHDKLARALGIKTAQVNAFVKLFDEGATVPFIARYRKEKTQNLDDAQLRALEKSLNYERDMASRRLKITELLRAQDNLTKSCKLALIMQLPSLSWKISICLIARVAAHQLPKHVLLA